MKELICKIFHRSWWNTEVTVLSVGMYKSYYCRKCKLTHKN